MQQTLTTLPGYRVYEYLLVLNPSEDLHQRILSIKKDFAEKYKAPAALQAKPHLPLAHFFGYQMTQERIINRLRLLAMGFSPFKMELKDFGAFPAHTLYINVSNKGSWQQLVKQLKLAQPLLTLNSDHRPHFIEQPHLSICRKLKPWQFEQGWLEYAHRHFTGRFVADSMVLLKRAGGEKGYQPIMRFLFQGMPVQTRQGSLFV